MSRARVLLVGENDVFLDGVAAWVAPAAELEVVGRAHTGSDALHCVESLRVDVVLMDVTLPDISGFETTRRIKARPRAPLVVLLSFHDSRAARLEARTAGANGFVPKPDTADRLIPVVRNLLQRRDRRAPGERNGLPLREPQ